MSLRPHARRQVYLDTFIKHPLTLAEAIRAQRVPVADGPGSIPDRIQAQMEAVLSYLTLRWQPRPDDGGEWLALRELFMVAQADFAFFDCSPPRHEDSLTGSLLARLSAASFSLNELLEQEGRPPSRLWYVELILTGGEQETGADLAFVLEASNQLFVSAMQAKRADPVFERSARVSVRRGREENNPRRQLEKLRELRESSEYRIDGAYLFYNNGPDMVAGPILPLVKSVAKFTDRDLRGISTDLASDTMDMASYITALMAQPGYTADEASLREIARLLVQNETRRVVCAGTSLDLGHRLAAVIDPEHARAVVHQIPVARIPNPNQLKPVWPETWEDPVQPPTPDEISLEEIHPAGSAPGGKI